MTSVSPNASREQANHVFVAGRWRARNSRRLQWPILSRASRQQPHRGSIQPMAGIKLPRVGARRVTPAAHRHPLNDVLPARDSALVTSGSRARVSLAGCLWPSADAQYCQTHDDRNPGKRSKVTRPETLEIHGLRSLDEESRSEVDPNPRHASFPSCTEACPERGRRVSFVVKAFRGCQKVLPSARGLHRIVEGRYSTF